MTKTTWVVGGLLIAALIFYGFRPVPIDVDLAPVSRGAIEVTVDDDGETRIREKYVISAPVTGKLLRIQIHPGDVIEQGVTELARIQPKDPALLDARTRSEFEARLLASEAAFQQAKATLKRAGEALELADHEYSRASSLAPNKTISQSEFDVAEHGQRMAQADVRSAGFAVKVAEYDLQHARAAASRYDAEDLATPPSVLRLISPINGRVLRVFQEDSCIVAPGTRLIEIGDIQDLELEIDVLSTDAVRIEPGHIVYVDHWGGSHPLEGVVRTVEPSAFLKVSALGVEEKRVNVIADFVAPWSSRKALGDGFRIEARIVVASTPTEGLKVPAGALFREAGSWKTYSVVDGRAKLTSIEVGETNGLETEIKSGLSEGELVVLHPADEIQAGVRVGSEK
ncbi:efflux transporter periplasmic adaptor subunit [Pirellulales bacterium]|nr:efflux transporter periplasmic adaptor subunit [Pirellulales bacterium]